MDTQSTNWLAVSIRLEKLERQNRRLKQVGAVALILTVSVLLLGQASPKKTVEANEFILNDTTGKTRAILTAFRFGPSLGLFDANGKPRVGMAIAAQGPELYLADANGKVRVGMRIIADQPELNLYNPEGKILWKAP